MQLTQWNHVRWAITVYESAISNVLPFFPPMVFCRARVVLWADLGTLLNAAPARTMPPHDAASSVLPVLAASQQLFAVLQVDNCAP